MSLKLLNLEFIISLLSRGIILGFDILRYDNLLGEFEELIVCLIQYKFANQLLLSSGCLY